MEVGEHCANGPEFVARQYENVSFTGGGLEAAVALKHVFQCPGCRRSHCDNAARGVQSRGCCRRHFEAFWFENVVRRVISTNGNECSDSDMQRDLDDLNSF